MSAPASVEARAPEADRERLQRSTLAVGLWVGGASTAIIALVTAVTVLIVSASSRADVRPGHDGDDWDERIVNVSQVVAVALVLGIIGILALAGIAWWAARRATLPLAEALRAQRSFVADASHELRTPLTTLTSRIQVAQHRAERGGDVHGALEALRRDAAVMDSALSDLLLAAEAAGAPVQQGPVRAVVEEAARVAVATVGPRASGDVVVDIPEGLVVAAEPTAVARALVALLDNAVRHSPSGGRVTLSARAAARFIDLRVADEGRGIVGIDTADVFERFASTRHGGNDRGFGLGLALVRDIAARFGGSIEVERTSPRGTVFLLRLPSAT